MIMEVFLLDPFFVRECLSLIDSRMLGFSEP